MKLLKVTTSGIVKYFLEESPSLRDNDFRLIMNVWGRQYPELTDSLRKIAYARTQGKISSPESIRRTRQKLQEDPKNEHLRGSRYKERQNKLEPEVREEIKTATQQGLGI